MILGLSKSRLKEVKWLKCYIDEENRNEKQLAMDS